MPYPTSPARCLAPLALLAAILATFLVVDSERSVGGDGSTSSPVGHEGRSAGTSTGAKAGTKTYTVKAGDTLSAIAARTGVPLETIQRSTRTSTRRRCTPGRRSSWPR